MKVKMRLVMSLIVLSAAVYVQAAEKIQLTEHDLKMINPEQFSLCMEKEHGEMMKCMMDELGFIKSDLDADQNQLARWKAPKEMEKLENPVQADQASLKRGRNFYSFNCSACHGLKARGDGPLSTQYKNRAANLTSNRISNLTDGELLWKIMEGGWPMPAFGYQDEWNESTLWDAINYIRSLAQ